MNKERLDALGPFFAMFAETGYIIFLLILSYTLPLPSWSVLVVGVFLFFLPYFACTCQHNRISILYSSGSLGAFIGVGVGLILNFLVLLYLSFAQHSAVRQSGGHGYSGIYDTCMVLSFVVIVPLFVFYFSRFFCHRARDKPRKKKKYGRKIKVAIRHEKTQ
ncbi:MAG: hypothetical protein QXU48_00365 [Thermoplasmata archaeon]